MTLVESFVQARERGQSLGDVAVLRRYQDRHRSDWERTVRFSDTLIQVFGSHTQVVAAARDLGLVGLDLVPGLRRWFGRQAMGLGGRRTRTGKPEGARYDE